MGSSSTQDQKTTTQQLTPEQQALVGQAVPNYMDFAASNPTLPGSAGVSPFDPSQTAGQNQVLAATPDMSNIVGGAGAANQYLTSGAELDPSSNPALRATQDAATRPLYDNLNEKVLPGIAADSSTSGSGGISANYGGSRQGIAEGLAIKGTQQAAKDSDAQIATAGYNKGLDALLSSIGQAPTTAAAQTIPGTATSTVGDIRQQQAQSTLSADATAKQFAQFLPLLKAQLLGQGAAGLPGGSATAYGTANTDANPVTQIVGGTAAAGGAAAGLAALLPLLAASDQRLKRNIKYLYTLPSGVRWYEFNYIWGGKRHEGVLAQEVRKILPRAVVDLGFLFVDYSQIEEVKKDPVRRHLVLIGG